jgi:septal ring factor EnvC (AmiA/AmiB activator)
VNAGVVIAIIAVAVSVGSLYFMARSNARDNEKRRLEAMGKAIADVAEPLQRRVAFLEQRLADRERRIEDLEDQLRGSSRP